MRARHPGLGPRAVQRRPGRGRAPIRFDTASGRWPPGQAPTAASGSTSRPRRPSRSTWPGVLEALGAGTRWVGLGRLDYLVELEDEAAVRDLAPSWGRWGGWAAAG